LCLLLCVYNKFDALLVNEQHILLTKMKRRLEHDVIDMLIFLLFGVLSMSGETEGKLISLTFYFIVLLLLCPGYKTDKLRIRQKSYA
jgi:hypothetical protein